MTAEKIWEQYQKAKDYCLKNDLFDNVYRNQRFYEGDQWYELKDENVLPHPVFNFIQRVCKYHQAVIVSNDIAVNLTPFEGADNEEISIMVDAITADINKTIENTKLKAKLRQMVEAGSVDGSAYIYVYFDDTIETYQPYKGAINVDLINNTNVFFGNPYDRDIQNQPYIMMTARKHIDQLKEMARNFGVDEKDIESIKANSDETNKDDDSDNLATVLYRFEKVKLKQEDGNTRISVKYSISIENLMIREDVDLGYALYPLSPFYWDNKRNSYLGISPITSMIPNQKFVNKVFALAQLYVHNNAFPKIIYDSTKISAISKSLAKDVAVTNMELLGKVMDGIKLPDFSGQVMELISATINYSKEFQGANDAALGNVRPDNTSAIIAAQQASSAPLEIQRLNFYDCVEGVIRIMFDIMKNDYGIRNILVFNEDVKSEVSYQIDYAAVKSLNCDLNVDIGMSSYFSELLSVNTIDNLFSKQIIPDRSTYLDMLPSKYIPKRKELQKKIAESEAQAEQMAQHQMIQSPQVN